MLQPQDSPDARLAAGRRGTESGGKPASECVSQAVLERAREIARATRHPLLVQTVAGETCELQALNNALMDTFREFEDVPAYSLLYELNVLPFSRIAGRLMRQCGSRADPSDILQEAFVAIFKYPTKFCAEKPNAFRNWSYSILRNCVFRSLSKDSKSGIPAELLADVLQDTRTPSPLQASQDGEQDGHCRRVYGILLCLYIEAYDSELKDRDRLALELVEVQGLGYKDAAEVLEIRLENFKMVVCRARKKILNSMVRVLGTRST